jgi:tripartite-type tricarboxylate transporter receptor subunit TctC
MFFESRIITGIDPLEHVMTLKPFGAFSAILVCVAAPTASAQTYPTKPVRLVVPFAAGGALDVVGRVLGAKLGESWGRQVIVENRLGAAGNIGAEFVAKAAPDGYTLLMSSVTTQAINMSLLAKPPYDFVRDYAPIALTSSAPLALIVHPALPAKTVKEFVSLAKARPGELNYFSSGTGSGTHMAAALFDQMAGVRTTHVPYKGGAQGVADLVSGEVQFAFSTLGLAQPHVQSGRLRMIAISAPKRYSRLPAVPTIAESGVKGYEAAQWYGVVAPAGTPSAVVSKLATDINAVVAQPDVAERFYSQGIEPVSSTPDQFAAFIKASVAKYAKIVQATGVKPE